MPSGNAAMQVRMRDFRKSATVTIMPLCLHTAQMLAQLPQQGLRSAQFGMPMPKEHLPWASVQLAHTGVRSCMRMCSDTQPGTTSPQQILQISKRSEQYLDVQPSASAGDLWWWAVVLRGASAVTQTACPLQTHVPFRAANSCTLPADVITGRSAALLRPSRRETQQQTRMHAAYLSQGSHCASAAA